MRPRLPSLTLGVAILSATVRSAHADPTAGVDSMLFRPSLDTTGIFSLEGARPMPARDLSFKVLAGYGQAPFNVAVPGIGGAGDSDAVLDYAVVLDFTFGLALTKRLTIGFDTAAYRSDTGAGYGARGRYAPGGNKPSTGLISLRPLSNLDPSGGFEAQSLSGPLDVRAAAKYAVLTSSTWGLALIGFVHLPFGEDEMFLGDSNLVFEPRLAFDWRPSRFKATRLVINAGTRFRERTVLEAYDHMAQQTEDDAKVVYDSGSEITTGIGMIVEISPRLSIGAEGMGFLPVLPDAVSFGDCRRANGSRCSTIKDDDYFNDARHGDYAAYATGGVQFRASAHLTMALLGGAGVLGARGDDFRFTFGAIWSPQPASQGELGRGDKDSDGIPDVSDVCSEESEDKDGYQDDDGCPERDNDSDGIQDVTDRCPDDKEDVDGFEDDDGCPDEDNDGDGFADKSDKCPNDPETVNGVDDDDGCPDIRAQTGPFEGTDRIDLRGNKVQFAGNSANLTGASKVILGQIAQVIRDRNLTIRVEVHVPLGTKSRAARQITRQKARDKTVTQRRAQAILDYLVSQGVPLAQLQAVGLGSDRPLGANPPEDEINERVDFIKAQQRTP